MDVETIDCGLHARLWSFNGKAGTGTAGSGTAGEVARQLVLLTDGSGEAEAGDQRLAISAPALLWLGDLKPGRLRLSAGTTGLRARIGDGTLVEAIGDEAQSVALRYLVDRDFTLSLAGHGEASGIIERCLTAVIAERRQPREASALLLSALLRIVLVSMLRVSGGRESLPGIGERMSVLQRFRQLVEMNFRNHWPVARYAAALGVSPDRLHAICTDGIGKTPKALVSERLAREAMLRLERSSLTIQQLGHSLGFSDPAHFSSFFRKMTGTPPGRYRRAVIDAQADRPPLATPSFAEWP